jgi:hypothetical protein
MDVGTLVEIIPDIPPVIFGGGGILTRDEYDIQPYQTNIAAIVAIGPIPELGLPAGTVMIGHGDAFSMYSIQHIRPYDPEDNSNSNNSNSNNNSVKTPPPKRLRGGKHRTRKQRIKSRHN